MKVDRPLPDPGGSADPHAEVPPGLRYVDDTRPGYTRRQIDGKFVYFDTGGKRIRDEAVITRINALAVPPAYIDVWICPDARGHLQATGRDARGRKQYRYHPRWRETRDATKYERMLSFGDTLPRIRARVTRDLRKPGMPREKVLAAVVRLLDTTLIRIGSPEYARDNRSYGLTTLRKRHLNVHAAQIHFKFRGKSGIEHDVTISDPRVARVVRRCMDLPGQDLFQYLDADSQRHTVSSADINDYLREISGSDFTAKDYRTWAGSVFALAGLAKLEWETVTEARRHIVATIKAVSGLLRNTPAVCRKCYVHPAIVSAFEAGTLGESLRGPRANPGSKSGTSATASADPPGTVRKNPAHRRGLRRDEVAFMHFLEHASQMTADSGQDLVTRLAKSSAAVRAKMSVNDATASNGAKAPARAKAPSNGKVPSRGKTPANAKAPTSAKASVGANS